MIATTSNGLTNNEPPAHAPGTLSERVRSLSLARHAERTLTSGSAPPATAGPEDATSPPVSSYRLEAIITIDPEP